MVLEAKMVFTSRFRVPEKIVQEAIFYDKTGHHVRAALSNLVNWNLSDLFFVYC